MVKGVHCDDARNLGTYVPDGSARLVFLDPPWNTGTRWADYDDRRSLDEWRDLIYEVVYVAHKALSPNGSLWLNLDESVSHHGRTILDEVFGPRCHVASIAWQFKYRAGPGVGIHTTHNPIHVYGRSPGWRRIYGIDPMPTHVRQYTNRDNDPRGPWRLTNAGKRIYLDDLYRRGAMPSTWWTYNEVGGTERANREVYQETGHRFATPKPLDLLRRIVRIATDPGDLVVDPMAGSGTTLCAAIELGRQAIGLEIERATVDRFILPRVGRRYESEHV